MGIIGRMLLTSTLENIDARHGDPLQLVCSDGSGIELMRHDSGSDSINARSPARDRCMYEGDREATILCLCNVKAVALWCAAYVGF